ncbi:ribosome assembly RNA-binding protein YhbY [Pseudogracilibacillus sp. SO30301A]|uniref:ribosome assembly RNA-binding protein YhbY n=1 Tax=Pseudogracilibacillus sp. SO30301A TaxID=3098291 RepID=UPI00300E12F5
MLSGKQKRFLRAKAHHLKAIFQVGKSGVTNNMIEQLKDVLEKRELIKISILQNCLEDKEVVAEQIATDADAEIVQIIGNNIILYKESEENKMIVLPE